MRQFLFSVFVRFGRSIILFSTFLVWNFKLKLHVKSTIVVMIYGLWFVKNYGLWTTILSENESSHFERHNRDFCLKGCKIHNFWTNKELALFYERKIGITIIGYYFEIFSRIFLKGTNVMKKYSNSLNLRRKIWYNFWCVLQGR